MKRCFSSRPKAPAILPSRRAHHRLTIEAVLADPDAALASALRAPVEDKAIPRIVAVTSCPTGIAHTFMAAEGLQEGARQLGYTLKVETQGSVGAGNPLTAEEIAQADVVLIAADREVDRSRFAGKRVFTSNTKPAITGGAALIDKALAEAVVEQGSAISSENAEAAPSVQAPTSI
jgi:PTS system fructose-specific IIC component